MVQVWHWYVSIGTKMEFMILLFVSIGISECFNNGSKRQAQILRCTCNNKAEGQAMPAVSFNGEVRDGKNCLRHLENNFDRLLMYKTLVG